MTAKKQSLLEKGVIMQVALRPSPIFLPLLLLFFSSSSPPQLSLHSIKNSLLSHPQDFSDTELLLSPGNVDQHALQEFARQAANFSTNQQLPSLDFALNHYGQPDVAMFDFTCMYASENAAMIRQRHGNQLLVALVGDSLLEVSLHLPLWGALLMCWIDLKHNVDHILWAKKCWSFEIQQLRVECLFYCLFPPEPTHLSPPTALLANGDRDCSRFPGSSRLLLDDQESVSRPRASGGPVRAVSLKRAHKHSHASDYALTRFVCVGVCVC